MHVTDNPVVTSRSCSAAITSAARSSRELGGRLIVAATSRSTCLPARQPSSSHASITRWRARGTSSSMISVVNRSSGEVRATALRLG